MACVNRRQFTGGAVAVSVAAVVPMPQGALGQSETMFTPPAAVPDDLRQLVRHLQLLAQKVRRCEAALMTSDRASQQHMRLRAAMVMAADDLRDQARDLPDTKGTIAWADGIVPPAHKAARAAWPGYEGLSPAFAPLAKRYEEIMIASARHEAEHRLYTHWQPWPDEALMDGYYRRLDELDREQASTIRAARALRPITPADLRFKHRISELDARPIKYAYLQARRTAHLRRLAAEKLAQQTPA